MLSFRVSLAVAALAAATAAPAAHAPGPAPCTGSDPDYAWTMDTLRDVVSFSDQLSVIRVVRQAIPPAPKGPEGWAGLIGRTVTVEVERTLWRRPGAPSAPARFRFSDWGWWGDLDHKRPTRIPGATRLRVGHRYLAAIARWHGTWLAHEQVRLLLKGGLLVGGVDCGEPSFAHQELAGRRLKDAAALVADTAPYRAAARHPGLDPAGRWQVVDRDRYRVEGKARNEPITVQAGITPQSRWTLTRDAAATTAGSAPASPPERSGRATASRRAARAAAAESPSRTRSRSGCSTGATAAPSSTAVPGAARPRWS